MDRREKIIEILRGIPYGEGLESWEIIELADQILALDACPTVEKVDWEEIQMANSGGRIYIPEEYAQKKVRIQIKEIKG